MVSDLWIVFESATGSTYVEQVLQQHIRLIFGHALDSACEASVDEDAFPSGHRWVWSVFLIISHESMEHVRFVRITGWTASNAEPWFSGDPRGIVLNGLPSLSASS